MTLRFMVFFSTLNNDQQTLVSRFTEFQNAFLFWLAQINLVLNLKRVQPAVQDDGTASFMLYTDDTTETGQINKTTTNAKFVRDTVLSIGLQRLRDAVFALLSSHEGHPKKM